MPRGVPKNGKRQPRGSKKAIPPVAAAKRAQKAKSRLSTGSQVETLTHSPVTQQEADRELAHRHFYLLTQSVSQLASINPQNLSGETKELLQNELHEQLVTLTDRRRALFGENVGEAVTQAVAATQAPAPVASPSVQAPLPPQMVGAPIVGGQLAQPGGIPQFAPPGANSSAA